jgi:hypothetical protein
VSPLRSRPLTLAGLLLLAYAATGAWLAQVVWVVGWEGLAWVRLIQGPETLPSCLCVALAMALPWWPWLRGRPWPALGLIAALWALSSVIYQAAAPLISGLFQPVAWLLVEEVQRLLLVSLGLLSLAAGGFSLLAWSLLRGLAGPVRWWALLLFPLAIALVVPASWLLAQLIPALNGAQDLIHAVKMGYPPGATALLLGLASWWARPGSEPRG